MHKEIQQLTSKCIMMVTCAFWIIPSIQLPPAVAFEYFFVEATKFNEHVYQRCKNKVSGKKSDFSIFFFQLPPIHLYHIWWRKSKLFSLTLFTFPYICKGRESIVLGSNFLHGDFDGFTGSQDSWIQKSHF